MFCLDTNIVIFALNDRRPGFRARLKEEQKAGTDLIIPAIVLFELAYGIGKSQQSERSKMLLDTFLAEGFLTPAFDAEDAEAAGDIRSSLERAGTPIGAYDILIAAQARRRNAVLVTANRREFERVPGLIVTDWGS